MKYEHNKKNRYLNNDKITDKLAFYFIDGIHKGC